MRLIVFCMGLLMAVQCAAGDIKAIVNDTPISAFDVDTRAKMLMLQQAGHVGKLSPELRKDALEDLIDERIKLQEMKKQGIKVTPEEVQNALAHLEAQNGLPAGGFQKIMAEQKIPFQTLVNQTTANLGWLQVMQKSGRSVAVKEADIRARQAAIKKDLARESVSFAEIVVPTEDEALTIWQNLQNGSDFGTQVELHSTADSRMTGGRVMDVTRDYYGAEVAIIFDEMQVGQLSRPIKVKDGYAIILMMNKREAVTGDTIAIWELAQAIVPEDSIANTMLQHPVPDGCQGFAEIVKDDAIAGSFQTGRISPAQLPSDIAPMLKPAPFKKVVGPLKTPAGSLYLMKCGSTEQKVMPSKEEIAMQIETEKMELLSRQLLSELKREVVVEYK